MKKIIACILLLSLLSTSITAFPGAQLLRTVQRNRVPSAQIASGIIVAIPSSIAALKYPITLLIHKLYPPELTPIDFCPTSMRYGGLRNTHNRDILDFGWYRVRKCCPLHKKADVVQNRISDDSDACRTAKSCALNAAGNIYHHKEKILGLAGMYAGKLAIQTGWNNLK